MVIFVIQVFFSSIQSVLFCLYLASNLNAGANWHRNSWGNAAFKQFKIDLIDEGFRCKVNIATLTRPEPFLASCVSGSFEIVPFAQSCMKMTVLAPVLKICQGMEQKLYRGRLSLLVAPEAAAMFLVLQNQTFAMFLV